MKQSEKCAKCGETFLPSTKEYGECRWHTDADYSKQFFRKDESPEGSAIGAKADSGVLVKRPPRVKRLPVQESEEFKALRYADPWYIVHEYGRIPVEPRPAFAKKTREYKVARSSQDASPTTEYGTAYENEGRDAVHACCLKQRIKGSYGCWMGYHGQTREAQRQDVLECVTSISGEYRLPDAWTMSPLTNRAAAAGIKDSYDGEDYERALLREAAFNLQLGMRFSPHRSADGFVRIWSPVEDPSRVPSIAIDVYQVGDDAERKIQEATPKWMIPVARMLAYLINDGEIFFVRPERVWDAAEGRIGRVPKVADVGDVPKDFKSAVERFVFGDQRSLPMALDESDLAKVTEIAKEDVGLVEKDPAKPRFEEKLLNLWNDQGYLFSAEDQIRKSAVRVAVRRVERADEVTRVMEGCFDSDAEEFLNLFVHGAWRLHGEFESRNLLFFIIMLEMAKRLVDDVLWASRAAKNAWQDNLLERAGYCLDEYSRAISAAREFSENVEGRLADVRKSFDAKTKLRYRELALGKPGITTMVKEEAERPLDLLDAEEKAKDRIIDAKVETVKKILAITLEKKAIDAMPNYQIEQYIIKRDNALALFDARFKVIDVHASSVKTIQARREDVLRSLERYAVDVEKEFQDILDRNESAMRSRFQALLEGGLQKLKERQKAAPKAVPETVPKARPEAGLWQVPIKDMSTMLLLYNILDPAAEYGRMRFGKLMALAFAIGILDPYRFGKLGALASVISILDPNARMRRLREALLPESKEMPKAVPEAVPKAVPEAGLWQVPIKDMPTMLLLYNILDPDAEYGRMRFGKLRALASVIDILYPYRFDKYRSTSSDVLFQRVESNPNRGV